MIRLLWRMICRLAMALVMEPAARADVVETFVFADVSSVSLAGDTENDIRTVASSAALPYTLGSLIWSGSASPTADPDDPTVFTSWGGDLGVRITHLPSATQADLILGSGEAFGPGPQEFAGTTRALNGLQVAAGDEFRLEFFEDFDDPFVSPDAVWHSIEFALSDDFVPPLGPPGEGIVRFQTRGSNTFPTSAGEPGGEFFRIQYGAGDGPAIVQAVLNTHARSRDDLWFDSDEEGEPPALQGTFQANLLDGVLEPRVQFEMEGADPAGAGSFAVLRLAFRPGDFTGGEAIHFGIDTDGGVPGPTTGDAMASLAPPLTVTVLFEDGTLVAGALREIRQDVDHAAVLELDTGERTLRGDANGDGRVDGDDLLDMLLHFGQSQLATHAEGDTDGNGKINAADVATWREQAGQVQAIGRVQAVPLAEPGSVWLALLPAVLGGFAVRPRPL